MDDCVFCKIVHGDIPTEKIYEDEDIIAFYDLHPKAPMHLLLIPKQHITSLFATTAKDVILLGKLIALAPQLAKAHGLEHGFKTSINTGKAGGQEIDHLHIHVYGTPQ